MTLNVRHAFVFVAALASFAPRAFAGDLSKEECVEAHSRGQDAKESGRLSLARKLFLTCAQPSCPSLVQGDCARFADDLTRLQPSLSFAARDASGSDLPDTTVYVDDNLLLTRLDGAPHDVDPGKHTIKFSNGGKDQVQTVVVGTGEKGRTVVATFGNIGNASAAAMSRDTPLAAHKPAERTTHPGGSKAMIIAGAALAVGGGVLGVVGITKVPSNCSISSHQCAAAPGDPVFDSAASGVRMSNYGFALGTIGVAAFVSGVVWYLKGSKTEKEESVAAAPWLTPNGGGIAISGHL